MHIGRYVILHHTDIPDPHFDLMIETSPGEYLMTWQLRDWPVTALTTVRRIADHRPAYLTFEGKLTGDRGCVRRVEHGLANVSATPEKIALASIEGGQSFTLNRVNSIDWQFTPQP